jgi:hypothetical protein
MPEEGFQNWKCGIRVSQLQAEQYGEQSPNDRPDNTGDQELFCNGFMVLAEDVLRNESLLMVMVPISISVTITIVVIYMMSAMNYRGIAVNIGVCMLIHSLFFF